MDCAVTASLALQDPIGSMPKLRVDAAVLGAGPAGSIAARQLGRVGIDVVLIDGGGPSSSHVIESLPPSGAPLADEIGLLGPMCEISDGPAAQMQMLWRDAPEVQQFEGNGPLLLRRDALHDMLRSEALKFAQPLHTRVRDVASTATGADVTTDAGVVSCKMVVDARGRHAIKRTASDLVALPFTACGEMTPHVMWLEAMTDGWIWACSLSEQMMHGALFQKASVLAGLDAQARLIYAKRCLAGVEFFKNVTISEIGKPAPSGLSAADCPIISRRHLLVGDAALARDPIASHGLVHAMRSAVQAAIAVQTILDPNGDSDAARSFLRHKHREAVATAHRATAQAYGDQARFQSPFWSQYVKIEPAAGLPQIGAGPVALSKPLTRAPVLEVDRIRWAPAIELPAIDDFMTAFGPVTALEIAAACRPSAPLQDIATRLGRLHEMPVVFEVLEHLTLGGAFSQASHPV